MRTRTRTRTRSKRIRGSGPSVFGSPTATAHRTALHRIASHRIALTHWAVCSVLCALYSVSDLAASGRPIVVDIQNGRCDVASPLGPLKDDCDQCACPLLGRTKASRLCSATITLCVQSLRRCSFLLRPCSLSFVLRLGPLMELTSPRRTAIQTKQCNPETQTRLMKAFTCQMLRAENEPN
jgi:hypothetical protein